MYSYFQQNQCLNIKKHAVHNIQILPWGPMFMRPPGNCPACPCVKTAQSSSSHDTTNPPNRSLTKIFTQNLATDGIRTLELVVLLTGCPCGRKYTYDVITTTKVLI